MPSYGQLIFCMCTDHGVTWKKAGTLYGIPYGGKKLSGDFIPDEPQVAIIIKCVP